MATKLDNVKKYIQHLSNSHDCTYDFTHKINGHALDDLAGYIGNKDIIHNVENVGGEGEGEYYHMVFKINHPVYGEVFLKVVGRYDSWNGVEWCDDCDYLCQHMEVKVMKYVDIQDSDIHEELSYEEDKKYLDFNSEVIRNWFKSILLDGVATIEFEKVDGTTRRMVCTLDKSKLPDKENNYENEIQESATETETAFRVYDLEKNAWRSIRWGYITSFNIEV
jgi:hypothetical protein